MPTDISCADRNHIIGEIGRIVTEVIGDDYLMDTEISASTSVQDLELESVEFISLASRLQSLYGEKVDFVAFMTQLEMDEIKDLTVGQLAEYISGRLVRADCSFSEASPDR
jgi:acyl carrier protein